MSIIDVLMGRPAKWAPVPTIKTVQDANGSALPGGAVMRRRVKGQWQYRAMTPEEDAIYDRPAGR